MRIACIQPEVFQERDKCYFKVEEILKKLITEFDSCDIVCLPERWVNLTNGKELNLQNERGNNYNFIKNLAKEYGISIISGTIWERRKNSLKPIITSYYFNVRKFTKNLFFVKIKRIIINKNDFLFIKTSLF